MKLKKRKIWWIIGIVVVLLIVVGVIQSKNKKTPPTTVTVEKAENRKIISTVSATGKVEPVTQVKISAEIPGKIVELPVKEGDKVEKGQFLVELDPKAYQANQEQAQSGLRTAKAQKEKAEADLKRLQDLATKGMASQADLDAAKAAAEMNGGQYDQAVAISKTSNESLYKTRISSPMAGTISALNKELGEITLGSQFQEDVIMVVADLSKMQVKAEVDENDIVTVKLGDSVSVEIDAFPDTTFRGVVAEISQSAKAQGLGQDQATNFTVKVTITDKVPGIKPGMSATVDIETDQIDNVLSISIQCVALRDKNEGKAIDLKEKGEPKSSKKIAEEVKAGASDTARFLRREDLQEGVFVFAGDSAVWKPVKTGISSDRYISVKSGLAVGDSVINGPYRELAKDLKNGSKVKIKGKDDDKDKKK